MIKEKLGSTLEALLENSVQIKREFFERSSVVVARELVGAIFVTKHPEGITAGRIVETEAYPGDDPASHVFNKLKPTPRTVVQYANAGHLYMYLIMGLHHMASIVTNKENIPDVVFIRSMEPLYGIDTMRKRRNYNGSNLRDLTRGPGRLSCAMGLTVAYHGYDIFSEDSTVSLFVSPLDQEIANRVQTGSRINLGIGKLNEQDANIATNNQLRFYLPESAFTF